ncbi:MAG: HAMP domain-containing protein [Clostridia bacterium]|nr:HAMP domain-containing protein [Clostridia bacterium]
MNKAQLKAEYKRQKKELKFQFRKIRSRAKYAYRIKKAELKFQKKNALEKEQALKSKRQLRREKKDYKQEIYLQKSIYLEKKHTLKKKLREELGSPVQLVTDRAPESLAGNLTLGYLLVFMVFAVVQSVIFIGASYYVIDRRANETLTNTAATLQAGKLEKDLAKSLSAEANLRITLCEKDGSSIYSFGLSEIAEALPLNQQVGEPYSYRYQSEELRIYTHEARLEGRVVYLNLAKSMKEENATLSLLVNLMLLSVALALAVSYFIGHRVTRNLLRPIGVLGRAMNEISVADLSQRLETENIRTELADVVQAYNRMLDKIEDAYLRQKQFVSDASHELRTPLAVISGYSDILSRWGTEDPAVTKEAIDAIMSQAEGMERLVERLLYIARSDNGAVRAELSEQALLPICEEILQDFRMMHPNRRFILSGEATARCDKDLIRQILVILLDNAAKFTAEEGEITVSLAEEVRATVLKVSDNGIGMSEEVAAHIFERFYKGDSSHNEKGFGLGLPIAKLMCEAQGGRISVESTLGVGTTFIIQLAK